MRRFSFFPFYVFCFCALLIAPGITSAQGVAQAVSNRQQELQNQLNDLESQIAVQQQLLDTAQNQHQTLQTQINAFNAEIKKTQLQIRAINVAITQLNGDIGVHNQTLSQLSAKLEAEKESLAQILRQTQVLDGYSVVSVALGSQSVSEFFKDLDAFSSIKSSLADSFSQIERTSSSTEAEKETLQTRLAEQQQLRQVAQVAEQSVQAQENDKQKLLTQTKGVEANYQKLIATTQKTAAQIRTELFTLAGGGGQISLPTAITLAKQAGAATGVRPAFILGILKQETNLGANVGQCLLTNSPSKGDGKGKNTGTPIQGVMKSTRDVDPFIAITSALGLDPFSMPVSCPQSTGYGGGMGPAQFIPSTWKGYQTRIAKLAGHISSPANPWDNLDAFTAIALYMTDLGAAARTPTAERIAALKYFAGGYYNNPRFAPYGDSVMQFASDFQQEINILGGF
jgi:peptidoglycan hydrolase CwlO-like protein